MKHKFILLSGFIIASVSIAFLYYKFTHSLKKIDDLYRSEEDYGLC